jgi:hypothetical protein
MEGVSGKKREEGHGWNTAKTRMGVAERIRAMEDDRACFGIR